LFSCDKLSKNIDVILRLKNFVGRGLRYNATLCLVFSKASHFLVPLVQRASGVLADGGLGAKKTNVPPGSEKTG